MVLPLVALARPTGIRGARGEYTLPALYSNVYFAVAAEGG